MVQAQPKESRDAAVPERPEAKPQSLIIDTDPGIDDAAAIAALLASDSVDVRLIASVSGNVDIGHTTENALKLLTFLGRRIPVARGAGEPLERPAVYAPEVHGDSGMDGFDFPAPDRSLLLDEDAIEAEARVLHESDVPVDILALGPLTNIALLIRRHPEVLPNIRRIVLMGGTFAGRPEITVPDFNIAVDPEAAAEVFASTIPIVMVGVEIGWDARLSATDVETLRADGPVGTMIAALFGVYDDGRVDRGVQMYDPTAAWYLLYPELFVVQPAEVGVTGTDGPFGGITTRVTFAPATVSHDGEATGESGVTAVSTANHVDVVTAIDVDGFASTFVNGVRRADARFRS
ncbi:nucleoside hydrolase [Bifidobacterium miconisargentati]|uniref:nucleoside hydrolase n=1 Tax=Bifidobacterium miconisargentati TaxID=2834437 RepID=UPI001BDDA065|nr:nucleoside hydrolase [Bifidobacterium miconisargentati]MBW3089697.1 nucleoside hydrolase [Bifidobacterium miconisargentati]